jgi:hypothetical protein
MSMNSDLRRAINNSKNVIKLDLATEGNENKPLITAFATEDLSYGIAARYNTPFDDLSFSASFGKSGSAKNFSFNQGLVEKYLQGGTALLNMLGAGIPQVQMKSVLQTVATYNGTDPITITLNLMFVTLDPEDNILDAVKALQLAAAPKGATTSGAASLAGIQAPLGYTVGLNSSKTLPAATGTIALSMGGWFQTPPVWLATSVNPTISHIQTKQGKPLYANVAITLQTFRIMFAEELNDWFKVGADKTSGRTNFSDNLDLIGDLFGGIGG